MDIAVSVSLSCQIKVVCQSSLHTGATLAVMLVCDVLFDKRDIASYGVGVTDASACHVQPWTCTYTALELCFRLSRRGVSRKRAPAIFEVAPRDVGGHLSTVAGAACCLCRAAQSCVAGGRYGPALFRAELGSEDGDRDISSEPARRLAHGRARGGLLRVVARQDGDVVLGAPLRRDRRPAVRERARRPELVEQRTVRRARDDLDALEAVHLARHVRVTAPDRARAVELREPRGRRPVSAVGEDGDGGNAGRGRGRVRFLHSCYCDSFCGAA